MPSLPLTAAAVLASWSLGGPVPCDAAANRKQPEAESAAKASIDGPESVPAHKLVRMRVTGLPVAHFILWDVYPPDDVDAATQRLKSVYEFVAPPGEYRVRVRAFRPDRPDDPPVDLWARVVIGQAPRPPPGPDPDDSKPDPDKPALTGLAKVSYDGAVKVNRPKTEARKLAEAQRGMASAIAAGAVPIQPAIILDTWRQNNNQAVRAGDWLAWGEAVSAELKRLHDAGKIRTIADWKEAFDAIAEGLEVVGA